MFSAILLKYNEKETISKQRDWVTGSTSVGAGILSSAVISGEVIIDHVSPKGYAPLPDGLD